MPRLDRALVLDAARYVDGWLEYQVANTELVGLAVGIQSGEDVLLAEGYGTADLECGEPMTAGHAFRVASHSKMFAATAVMQLRERGLLRLDDEVARHLPEFAAAPDPAVATMTVRQLLSHSAGVIRDGEEADYWQLERDFPDVAELRRAVAETGAVIAPNERFKYSNIGYGFLGLLIEKVSGQPFRDFVTEHILDRLGLADTGPDLDERGLQRLATGYSLDLFESGRRPLRQVDTGALSAATGFLSTVTDLCRFGSAHFLGNEELLTDDSKREMQRLQWTIEREENDYGLGLVISKVGERRLVGHGGGFPGFLTTTKIDPVDQLVVTVLSNALGVGSEQIADGIVQIIDYFQEKGSAEATGSPHDLARFEGRFYDELGVSDVVRVGNMLVLTSPAGWSPFERPDELRVSADGELRISQSSGFGAPGEPVKFWFGGDGRAERVRTGGRTAYPWAEFERRARRKR